MNKDSHLIFEAYKKRLDESELPRLSPVKPIGAEKEIKYTQSKDGNPSQPYLTYTLNGAGKNVYFYYDKDGNFQRGLIKGGSTSGMDLKPFNKEDIEKIAGEHKLTPDVFHKAIEEGGQKIKAHHSSSEDAEESSELTMEHLVKAIDMALQPFRFECEVCYLGQVMDVLEKFGFKIWGNSPDRESFNKCWKEFVSKNAYCYDMNASDDPYEDREHTENKIEKNGPGEYLFMEGSGRGPDAYLAAEFASKHGYKKLILNGLS
jgi:hypothetical protein